MTTYSVLGFSEPFSSLSHLLAAIVCGFKSAPLLKEANSHGKRWMFGIFCFATVFLLSMSGVFHLLPLGGNSRAVLQRLDHAAIFVLIAGTFTPVVGILLAGAWRWGMLLFIWTLAITGLTLKTIYFNQVSELLSVSFYLGMGWSGLLAWLILLKRYGFKFGSRIMWGAIAYSVGALIDFFQWPIIIPGFLGSHEIFHIAVLFGIYFHWKFIADLANHSEDVQSYSLNNCNAKEGC